MKYLKTFEQSFFDKVKGKIKDTVKEGGMFYIKNTTEFKKLNDLINQHKKKVELEKKRYDGEVYTNGGVASEEVVNLFNQNMLLLDETVEKYISRNINKKQVLSILDNKINEIEKDKRADIFQDTKEVKRASLALLNSLKEKVNDWLI